MKVVEVYGYSGGVDKKELIGTITFNKRVNFNGISKQTQRELKAFGIFAPGGPVYPKDGMKFMQALKRHFSGSSIRATDVFEK